MKKTHQNPLFEFVTSNETNKVFLAASGPDDIHVTLGSMTRKGGSWIA